MLLCGCLPVAASEGYSRAVCRLLTVLASLDVEYRLQSTLVSVGAAHGLSCCGSRSPEHRLSNRSSQARFLRGVWNLPRSGTEPVSPASAGGLLTPEPPGKHLDLCLVKTGKPVLNTFTFRHKALFEKFITC